MRLFMRNSRGLEFLAFSAVSIKKKLFEGLRRGAKAHLGCFCPKCKTLHIIELFVDMPVTLLPGFPPISGSKE